MYTYGALKEAQLFEMLSLISNNQTCSVVQNYAQTAQSNYKNLVNFEIRFLLHFISKEEDTVVFTHEGVSCIPLMSRGPFWCHGFPFWIIPSFTVTDTRGGARAIFSG